MQNGAPLDSDFEIALFFVEDSMNELALNFKENKIKKDEFNENRLKVKCEQSKGLVRTDKDKVYLRKC